MKHLLCAVVIGLGAALSVSANEPAGAPTALVAAMKEAPRGPFARIRWFCRDGSVLPPKPSACSSHGGGVQHGELSAEARGLREAGYGVANVLAATDATPWTGDSARLDGLKDLILERFLVASDDGWIFRKARSYRGALQVEDEEAAAARIVETLSSDPSWARPERTLLLRELVRWLPLRTRGGTNEVRRLAAELAEADPSFAPLRNKIHSFPERDDASAIRRHSQAVRSTDLAAKLERLASDIETLFDDERAVGDLRAMAHEAKAPALVEQLSSLSASLQNAVRARDRLRIASSGLVSLRDRPSERTASDRRIVLQASETLERIVFTVSAQPDAIGCGRSRVEALRCLSDLRDALYGTGLLSGRQRDELAVVARHLQEPEGPLRLGAYRDGLRAFARAADWATRALEFHLGERIEALAALDPLVRGYVPDRVRGSPLLAWNRILEALQTDAAALSGARNELFGESISRGLRGLNPGIARGVLSVGEENGGPEAFARDGIYVLPNTVAELPPVAGILTKGEGSSLSHVQLLARNLGIPNVVVDEALSATLEEHAGERVILASSPAGRVVIEADGEKWDDVFGRALPEDDFVIRPDLAKLDLTLWKSAPLTSVRATDSGRVVGPKAANLGELHALFPGTVPHGVVVPFGAFRRLVSQPLEPGGPSVFDWMVSQYAALRRIDDHAERSRATAAFLARLRGWIENAAPRPEFIEDLRSSLERELGPDGSYGVFVRSDTNVEDLPGFTGAGLNLTLPNVVGFDAILAALLRVWASPFTERAFAWRQASMEDPAYVFPGVVLLESFASEKSGVMVTADVDDGDREWLSIAVSEGVGGAVEGQAAEELRVRADGSEVRLVAQATASRRVALDPSGGIRRDRATGTERVLQDDEIARLVDIAKQLPSRYPSLAGQPADVEFGFAAGRLALLQIRPFVESKRARGSLYLQALDRPLEGSARRKVDLSRALKTDEQEAR